MVQGFFSEGFLPLQVIRREKNPCMYLCLSVYTPGARLLVGVSVASLYGQSPLSVDN